MTYTRTNRKRKHHNAGASSPGATEGGQRSVKHASKKNGPFYSAGPALRLGAPVQTKIAIGHVDDPFEREADLVSDRVTAGQPAPPISRLAQGGLGSAAQRQVMEDEPIQELAIQRQADDKEEEPVQELTIQRQADETEEEPVQELAIQRQADETEDEPVQELAIQHQADEMEEEPVQEFAVQRQADDKEEEPVQELTIQRQADEMEEEPVQEMVVQREVTEDMLPPKAKQQVEVAKAKRDNKAPEDEALQHMAIQRQTVEEEKPVQTSRSGYGTGNTASMTHAASHAINHKGPGEALNPATRNTLESQIGMDFSDVRVHSDSSSQEAAKDLNARAFTNRSDIWLGSGESQSDLSLMAHEATHVVQQTGSVQRKIIQKAGKKGKNSKGKAKGTVEGNKLTSPIGSVDEGNKVIEVKQIALPSIKIPFTQIPITLLKKEPNQKRDTKQIQIWEEEAGKSTAIDDKIKADYQKGISKGKGKSKDKVPKIGGVPYYPFRLANEKSGYVLGPLAKVKKAAIRPFWSSKGKFASLHVDHQHEIQLGGPDAVSNMWLLDAKANMSSGGMIQAELEKRIMEVANLAYEQGLWPKSKDYKTVRTTYAISLLNKVPNKRKVKGNPANNWKLDEIKAGKPIEALKPLTTSTELKQVGIGKTDSFTLFTRESGGDIINIPWGKKGKKKSLGKIGENFEITSIDESATQISGKAFGEIRKKKKKHIIKPGQQLNFDITRFEEGVNMGYVSGSSVIREVRKLEATPFSPISFENAGLDPVTGIVARGKINANLPYFNNFDVDIGIFGNDIRISKTFDTGDFQFPGPIQVTGSNLTLFGGTDGLGLSGEAFIDVKGLGTGRLFGAVTAKRGSASSFELGGEINLDTSLFKPPSKIDLKYAEEKISGGADLHLDASKIKGVKSAKIIFNIDGEKWEAQGSVKTNLPGIKKADLEAKYDPEQGLVIGGKLDLSEDLPRVKGGSVEAKVTQKEDGEYKVAASGSAELDIPGVDASVDVKYDDGLFLAKGTVAYKKGMLEGSITAGATNMAVSEEGTVIIGEPGKKITPFGQGSVTVTIAPWLKGSVGIKLRPNGEIEVTGEIALPSSLEIFKKLEYKKNIFETPSIDIPIIGFTVPVIGTRVGIFATIKGGMDAHASIGAGELTDLGLAITYNPQREDETHVVGKARLQIPAEAGLSLYVKGGLGVGIPIVDAEVGLKVSGELGIEGAASAAVDVDWTPTQGLVLDAKGEIFAEPKFKFGIDAYALVTVDLPWPFDDRTLYDETWNLANYEFGSGLRFGLLFPFHYEEGQTPDIALADVEFQAPEISVKDVISGIVDQIV